MAKKKADGEGKGGPKKLAVPVIALLLGVFVGPKFLGGGGGEAAAGETTTTTAPGPVITLESITLNLTDGHLLKVGIALQISAEHAAEAGGGHGGEADDTDPTRGYARALDAAIAVFSERSMEELLSAPGREAARTELNVHLEEAYHGEIEGVYLYEFVMQ
jgi:flagellar FliL protein